MEVSKIPLSDDGGPHLPCGTKKADPGSFHPLFPFFRIVATGLFPLIYRRVFRKTLTLGRIAISRLLFARKSANTELVSLVDRPRGLSMVRMAGTQETRGYRLSE
jgi:hypothetical protein